MSSISGVGANPQANVLTATAAKKPAAAAAMVRDSDGDHDGTAPGKVDAKDLGKGVNVDRQA